MFNLGGVVDAFAGRKLKRINNNENLQDEINRTISTMPDYRKHLDRYLGDYDAGMKDNIAEQRRLGKITEGEIGGLLSTLRDNDYLSDRERIREGDLAAVNSFISQMGGGGSREDKAAMARLGYAGRPSGSYATKVRQSYLTSTASPLIAQVLAGLNTGANQSSNSRRANVGQSVGLIRERNDLPDRITDRMLAPMNARISAKEAEIGALDGMADVDRKNLQGFKEEKNKWAAALMEVDKSLNSALDTYLSMYSGGMMGGGGGGGIMGMMGGGGGGGGTGDGRKLGTGSASYIPNTQGRGYVQPTDWGAVF